MHHRTEQSRRTILVLLSCVAMATSSGCTRQASEYETATKACRAFEALVRPYSVQSTSDASQLLRPATSPEQWREDANEMKDVAGPLLAFEGEEFDVQRLAEFGQRMVMLADYLITTSESPDEYDTDVAAGLVYPAEGICSDAIEEAA